jgi:NADH-quinone oxidoreductase subunit C
VIADGLIKERGQSAGDDWIAVEPAQIREALTSLKDDGYTVLVFLTCVDHLADQSRDFAARYELVYQLRDMDRLRDIRVRTFVDGEPPEIASAHDIFPPANWDERETFDMFGIKFTGHPDLTRILMPDDWVGYPLRRDFPVGGEIVEFSEEHETWNTAPEKA